MVDLAAVRVGRCPWLTLRDYVLVGKTRARLVNPARCAIQGPSARVSMIVWVLQRFPSIPRHGWICGGAAGNHVMVAADRARGRRLWSVRAIARDPNRSRIGGALACARR